MIPQLLTHQTPPSFPLLTLAFGTQNTLLSRFTIPLASHSQDLFAFTWTDPATNLTKQLTCTTLPQGFRDSPHLFSQALPLTYER